MLSKPLSHRPAGLSRPRLTTMRDTPWGRSDYALAYGPGVTFYGTPSHGGFLVEDPALAQMEPELLKKDGSRYAPLGWFEEDCEWCFVAVAFPEMFTKEEHDAALSTMRNDYPDTFETIFGLKLTPAESRVVRERTWRKENVGRWATKAAWGDWHPKVPKGQVGVVACRVVDSEDPNASRTGEETWWLVPADEYACGSHGFVIDEARHAPWTDHA